MATIPTIEAMLKSGMHFGHRSSKWHPKMAPFIFGQRNGVHIIDLTKSQKLLQDALDFMARFAAEGKLVLFVGTKLQAKAAVKAAAEATGMPYVSEKWMGGTLTNFGIIKKMIKRYRDLVADREAGKLTKYTKKERLEIDREIERLTVKVGGIANLNRLPDAIFIWDIKTEKTALTEAKRKNVPIIAVCDTNVNPTGINHVIPSNDDATKAIKLVMDTVVAAINEGKAKKGGAEPMQNANLKM